MQPEKASVACKFCRIIRQEIASNSVFEDQESFAFLDHRPLFPGHTLLVPKTHLVTLLDVPRDFMASFFGNAQMLARAVEEALGAEGSFVAINNRVSQSVPHLHVHIVPRRKGDGLKGFFWPRHSYKDAAELSATQTAIRRAIERRS